MPARRNSHDCGIPGVRIRCGRVLGPGVEMQMQCGPLREEALQTPDNSRPLLCRSVFGGTPPGQQFLRDLSTSPLLVVPPSERGGPSLGLEVRLYEDHSLDSWHSCGNCLITNNRGACRFSAILLTMPNYGFKVTVDSWPCPSRLRSSHWVLRVHCTLFRHWCLQRQSGTKH